MSDSPIESTKGLHESKERKSEPRICAGCGVPLDGLEGEDFITCYTNGRHCASFCDSYCNGLYDARVALPRGAEPETLAVDTSPDAIFFGKPPLSPRGDDGTAKALKQEQKHEG